jgi:hypothetical protein
VEEDQAGPFTGSKKDETLPAHHEPEIAIPPLRAPSARSNAVPGLWGASEGTSKSCIHIIKFVADEGFVEQAKCWTNRQDASESRCVKKRLRRARASFFRDRSGDPQYLAVHLHCVTAAAARDLQERYAGQSAGTAPHEIAKQVTAGLCALPNVWPPRGRIIVHINTSNDDPSAGKRYLPRSKQLVRFCISFLPIGQP